MNTETIVITETSASVNVAAGKITSLRDIDSRSTAVRVYDNNTVAIAGAEGAADVDKLTEQAKANLHICGVPYPDRLEKNVKHVDDRKRFLPAHDFLPAMRDLIARMTAAAPDFLFSNKIQWSETSTSYRNSLGADLSYAGDRLDISLSLKERRSANIMDLFYGGSVDYFDPDAFVADVTALTQAFIRPVDLPEGLPVVVDARGLAGMLLSDTIAESYLSGAGKLKDKLGTKCLSDKFNVSVSGKGVPHRPYRFFDAEGVVLDDFPLFERGVFKNLLTTKLSATQCNIPLSGGAEADEYDAVPSYSGRRIVVKPTADKLTDVVDRAVYIAVTSGGDITDKGDVGLPVQAAFLMENGRLVGRLPELMVSGNIFDVLGKGLLGIAARGPLSVDYDPMLVAEMHVAKQ